MKIALVSPYDYANPGGVINHICHLCDQFVKMGHVAKIITPCSDRKACLDSQHIIALGRPFPVPSGGSIARTTLSPALSRPARAILETERFDIIHLHEPLGSTLPLTILRVSQSVNVGTFHACHREPRGYKMMRPFVIRWFNKLDGKIAVSKPAMNYISKHFPGDYTIIPNGIDVEHFSIEVSPIERFCDGKLNILFVSRLEKRKGLMYLLNAYKEVKRELPNSRLIVVGPGARWDYEKAVSKANLEDVVFIGYVSNEDLPRYYKTADLFCAPATGGESFGIVLLEAMAAAKPIVASHIDGYASVISHGAEGLLVPPRDEQALATAIIQLLSDESLRQEMGSRGRLNVEKYDWQNIARRVVEYYTSLLDSS